MQQTTVIKTKSVEYMPFLLSFFLFVNAGVWSIYAVLVKDIYIGVSSDLSLKCIFEQKYFLTLRITLKETSCEIPEVSFRCQIL